MSCNRRFVSFFLAALCLAIAACDPVEQSAGNQTRPVEQKQEQLAAEQQPAPVPQQLPVAPPPPSEPSPSAAALRPAPRSPAAALDLDMVRRLQGASPRLETPSRQSAGQAGQSGEIRRYAAPPSRPPVTYPGVNRFPETSPEPVRAVADQPVSTFSVDVDTASYALARRHLRDGHLPPREAVRVEEMVNYFRYDYPAPRDRAEPFRTTVSTLPTPWNRDTKLLHIGIRGYDIDRRERPRLNLALLIDVSGSMAPDDRLPLLKRAFARFVDELRPDDRVAIVTYANGTRVALEPTAGRERQRIVDVIESLGAAGGTAGGEGLQLAYRLAERNFDSEAVNRVILATDGDFNIGMNDPKQLESFIAEKRKTGIYLSVLGVGVGNLNDEIGRAHV